MKAIIVEDEMRAARRLSRMIKAARPDISICGQLASIASARLWFSTNPPPDLVFLDIQLEDGDAFELLEAVEVAAPVIFCTAYVEHALRAFKVNSIDYLLKPVTQPALEHALAKYDKLVGLTVNPETWRNLHVNDTQYRQRFLAERHRALDVVPVSSVVALKSWMKVTQLITTSGEELICEESLAAVLDTLDPSEFIQISRQTAVRVGAVRSYHKTARICALNTEMGKLEFSISRARQKSFADALERIQFRKGI
ncbi:LytR/AlgR family response regulator transcription factor [Parasphingopyxis lamellibrachiae]|uniref:LytTR family two component transcriptional regulator n=1 Tax=Parasphingopyxis lamellibrachiae TaxID=680125 RepID=A0A3D9FGQ6_9SPHN|nr:LytTR family DNA-binding domain-containing protein [Parasphingopyxis lamellibrachiae]RED16712.1 LytTR family two component transcriptional regulator [Parasphingopyxis lamellibrachiae]